MYLRQSDYLPPPLYSLSAKLSYVKPFLFLKKEKKVHVLFTEMMSDIYQLKKLFKKEKEKNVTRKYTLKCNFVHLLFQHINLCQYDKDFCGPFDST